MSPQRCQWPADDPAMIAYHDDDWGTPTVDTRKLFEALTLESAQSGLSWRTILNKREGYRDAFQHWDIDSIAEFGEADIDALVQNPEIVRHRRKIESTVANARAVLNLHRQGLNLADIVWAYVDGEGKPLSRELKRRGFRFVGPTTCTSFMESVGIVNHHELDCFRYEAVERLRDTLLRERSSA